MFDLKQELSNYSQIDLNKVNINDPAISDEMMNSVTLFNKALLNLQQNSEDIAIIELKRAIALNPAFIDALNLLGACYISQKSFDKALVAFEKVIKLDPMNDSAMRYISILPVNSIKTVQKEEPKEEVKQYRERPIKQKRILNIDSPKRIWKPQKVKMLIRFLIIIGAILVAIYIFGLILTAINNAQKSNNGNNNGNKMTIEEYQTENERLIKENKELKAKLKALEKDNESSQGITNFMQAKKLAEDGDFEAAADLLVQVKTDSFSVADKAAYDKLALEVLPKATNLVATEGMNLFSSGNYAEAIEKLIKVDVYSPNYEGLDSIYYNMGKSYVALGEIKKAKAIYNKLIKNYPNSIYAGYAKNRLNDIKAGASSPVVSATASPSASPTTT